MSIVHVVIAVAALAAGQTPASPVALSGQVLDARTGQVLPDVIVNIEGQPGSVKTGSDGRFQVDLPPGSHELTVSLVGYAVMRVPVEVPASGAPPPVTIRLSEGAGSYEEHVTVSGASAPDQAPAPAGALLYGRELFALRGVTLDDPIRAVHALPSASATDDFYSEFAVRGSPYRHVGFSVDGMPSRYLTHSVHGVTDGGSITMINSDAVGSISLLPGSYPQRTGRQLSAQMDLTMREGVRDEVRVRAGLSGTSAAVLAEGPIGDRRGSWLVSARRSYLDYLLKRIEEDSSIAFGFTDVEAKVVVDLGPRHQLQVLGIGGASAFDESEENLAPNDEVDSDGRQWLSGVAWRYTPTPSFALTQRVFATGLSYTNHNTAGGILDDAGNTDAGWRADASMALRPGLLLEGGGDVLWLKGRHTRNRALNNQSSLTTLNTYSSSGRTASAYAQMVMGRAGRFSVAPGARMDYWGLTDTVTGSPWITADVTILEGTHLRGGAGIYRQFAGFEQIEGIRGGGADLRPETARHVDIGVTQSLPHAVSLQVTGYARRESDVLWTPGSEPRRRPDGTLRPGFGNAPWVNALDGRAHGVEVVLRRDAPSGLSGWASYAYGHHEMTDPLRGEEFFSDFDQRHAVSLFGYYRISGKATIGAKFRYGSNYPLVGYIGPATPPPGAPALFGGETPVFYSLVETRNTLRLPAYARLDVRADRSFTWSGKRMTLFVEVANVLDRANVRNVPYAYDPTGRVYQPTDTLMPIVPSAGFVIEF